MWFEKTEITKAYKKTTLNRIKLKSFVLFKQNVKFTNPRIRKVNGVNKYPKSFKKDTKIVETLNAELYRLNSSASDNARTIADLTKLGNIWLTVSIGVEENIKWFSML